MLFQLKSLFDDLGIDIMHTRMKRTTYFCGHCVDSCMTVVPAVAMPFLAVDRDKMTTSGVRISELHAWYRGNFSDTLLNT